MCLAERRLEPNSSATMSKKEQVLVIEPPIGVFEFESAQQWRLQVNVLLFTVYFCLELTFTGPFTTAVSSYMKLKNPSDRKVVMLRIYQYRMSLL